MFPALASATATPNVVVILVDDMGYGDIQCYNADSNIPTPTLDALANDGMRFTDAHSPGPICHPSRYGLLTGRYPWRTTLPWDQRPCIEEGRMTIASLLQDNGYHTAMVGKWHLGFTNYGEDKPHRGGPADLGFDHFFGIPASTDIPPYYYIRGREVVAPPIDHIEANASPDWSPIQGAFWRAGGIAPGLELAQVLPRFTDEAVEVIARHHQDTPGQPLFLYLAYPAPHTPWLPAEEFVGQSGAGSYGDFVVMVDAMIGRILAALDDAEMGDDTLVIVTSDNGPVWYDVDTERFDHDANGGLRGMKFSAWEGGHRMPFIVRWPGRVEAGSISDTLICFTDLLATLADLLDADLPNDAGEDSFSFLPAMLPGPDAATAPREAFVMAAQGQWVMRQGPWKLIIHQEMDGRPGQLYHLTDDPDESNSLYQEHPETVAQLTDQLRQILQADRSRP